MQLQRLERPALLQQQQQLPPQRPASTSTLQPTCQRLQPHVPELQPHVPEAATPCARPATLTQPRVAAQERVSAAALLLVGLRPSAAGSALPAYAAAARLRFGVR